MAKQRSERAAKKGLVKLCSYVALVLSALMFIIGGLFSGSLMGRILNLVAQIALLIGIAFPAYDYSRGLHKAWRVVYWIALFVYLFGCVLGVLNVKIF